MSTDSIMGRITRPEDCVLGFGIPTTEQDFLESRRSGPRGCFARRPHANPYTYRTQVIEPCARLGASIRRLGARVVPDLTLAGYADLFRAPETHAVILISHWDDDFIEFRDGLAGIDAIVEAIPGDFAGVIDLCVCHPDIDRFIPLLRDSHRESFIHYIQSEATPIRWLYFYRDLFRFLHQGKWCYLKASVRLVAAHFERPRKVRP